MEFGEKLRNLREKKGLSQKAVALLVGARDNTIWSWENGRYAPIERRQEMILAQLDMPTPIGLNNPLVMALDSNIDLCYYAPDHYEMSTKNNDGGTAELVFQKDTKVWQANIIRRGGARQSGVFPTLIQTINYSISVMMQKGEK
jgi:transcriptional regulator with XRE-family HTH domain